MSGVTRPRGPLPARVYWTRRAVVLLAALVLVFGLGRVLGALSDGSSEGADTAATVAGDAGSSGTPSGTATTTETPAEDASTDDTTDPGKGDGGKGGQPPLAAPDGPCSDDEVLVNPVPDDPRAGGDVRFRLAFTSTDSEACTFTASASTVTLKLVSGDDFIWSTQECSQAMPQQELVVRRAGAVRSRDNAAIDVIWPGRRSNDACDNTASWADTGDYHAIAAVLGGEPTDRQFTLQSPAPITQTAEPSTEPSTDPSDKPTKKPQRPESTPDESESTETPEDASSAPTEEPSGAASDDPSGAVEPD